MGWNESVGRPIVVTVASVIETPLSLSVAAAVLVIAQF